MDEHILIVDDESHVTSALRRTFAYDYKKEQQTVDLDSLLLAVFRQYRPLEENVAEEAGKHGPRLTDATTYRARAGLRGARPAHTGTGRNPR
ncbi:MAG: hypothetical protein M3Y39_21645 [Chloroflexota bacterium]|nr:hypothetical protein [Chloroflexota bacterium]